MTPQGVKLKKNRGKSSKWPIFAIDALINALNAAHLWMRESGGHFWQKQGILDILEVAGIYCVASISSEP